MAARPVPLWKLPPHERRAAREAKRRSKAADADSSPASAATPIPFGPMPPVDLDALAPDENVRRVTDAANEADDEIAGYLEHLRTNHPLEPSPVIGAIAQHQTQAPPMTGEAAGDFGPKPAPASLSTTTQETTDMARAKSTPAVLPDHEKNELIQRTFPEILSLKKQIAALMEQHVKPVQRTLKKTWGELKAKTGTERADLDLLYRLYERDQLAGEMDEDTDRDRIMANLRRTFEALKDGDMLSFLDALEQTDDDMFEGEGEQAETDSAAANDDAGTDPAEQRTDAGATERTEAEPGPTMAEGGEAETKPDDFTTNTVGAFNEGKAAGLAGKDKDANPYDKRTSDGKAWEKGRLQTAPVASEVDAYNEGWAAHKAGEPREANPYEVGTDNAARWGTGWYERAKKQARDAGDTAGDGAVLH